jgi:hypothetical protein
MMTKTKIALAALLVAGSASFAAAQEADPNLFNRYPVYNGADGVADAPVVVAPSARFQSAPVSLNRGSTVGFEGRSFNGGGTGGTAWTNQGRAQVHSFHYDSAPLGGGAGN